MQAAFSCVCWPLVPSGIRYRSNVPDASYTRPWPWGTVKESLCWFKPDLHRACADIFLLCCCLPVIRMLAIQRGTYIRPCLHRSRGMRISCTPCGIGYGTWQPNTLRCSHAVHGREQQDAKGGARGPRASIAKLIISGPRAHPRSVAPVGMSRWSYRLRSSGPRNASRSAALAPRGEKTGPAIPPGICAHLSGRHRRHSRCRKTMRTAGGWRISGTAQGSGAVPEKEKLMRHVKPAVYSRAGGAGSHLRHATRVPGNDLFPSCR